MDRRAFIARSGLALTAGLAAASCEPDRGERRTGISDDRPRPIDGEPDGYDWDWVRRQFALSPDRVHMSALLISSHPRQVREALERYRQELDADPVATLENHNDPRRAAVREAAARYLGASANDIALTDSTTMGIALVYHGLPLGAGDEVLTSDHDYYATHESLRLATLTNGAQVRRIALHHGAAETSEDEIVANLLRGITPRTRALALTWVHSSTGLKLPVSAISRTLSQMNASRPPEQRVLLCIDGVHGFGVEDAEMGELGCDFFMAGCHKWLFGPRGTGIVWGRAEAWASLRPTVPSFTDGESWNAWAREEVPTGPTTAARVSPGGFKPFEHQWAVAEAFGFHQEVGKRRVAERTHQLATQLKAGLAELPNVRLLTPRDPALSAGIVCFEIPGMGARQVVERLRQREVIATTTPYAESFPRLTPAIYNTPAEVERAVEAVRAVA